MNTLLESFALWLADYYLLTTALLALALASIVFFGQPIQRLTIAKSAIAALILLAALCALPGWSLVHVLARQQAPQLRSHQSPAAQYPATEYPVPNTSPAPAYNSVPESLTASDPSMLAAETRGGSPITWKTVLALAHALGAACVFAWLIVGSLAAHRLRRHARPAPPELTALMNEVADPRDRNLRQIELRTTDRIDVPVALGIWRPVILLPEQWINNFPLPFREGLGEGSSHSQRRSVLAHELAHIHNHDLHWLAASRALLILLWAQPLYWLLRRRMRLDQETLADAAAAELTSRQCYAEQLVAWAREMAPRPALRLSSAVGLWEGPSQLRRRVGLLLDEHFTILRQCPRRWQAAIVALCASAALGLSLVTLEPVQSEPVELDPASAADSTKPESSKNDKVHPITVSGRAIDNNGDAIKDATIYLVTPRNGPRRLATATTADDGSYRFDNVSLPIKREPGKNAVGCFEVFGQADGFGFAWRPLKWFYPDEAHGNDDSNLMPSYDRPTSYGRDDAIELDVHFGPAAKLRGRIRNDLGEPIADTPVAIRDAHPVDDRFDARALESFNQSLVPEGVKIRHTDKDGRFEFTALPDRHVFRLGVKPPGYTPIMIYAATLAEASKNDEGSEIFGDNFEVIFERPRTVKLRIVYGDTGEPAAKVGIGGKVTEAGFWKTTNANGIVEVPLPDGQYNLSMSPRYQTPYLLTEAEVNVSAEVADRITTLKLQPAAVANISVIDTDTLEPIPGVDVWIEQERPNGEPYREVHGYRSWEVETRISHYESPRSDDNGEMRVLFELGKHRIGVAKETYPKQYEPVERDGKVVQLAAGKPQQILFQLRKRAVEPTEKDASSSRSNEGAADVRVKAHLVQQTTSANKSATTRPPALLSYGDGKPDGKKSYGGSGHMIRFEMPEGVIKVRGIRIHSSRYGFPQAPDEDAEITFLSEDRDETLHTEAAPYRAFKRGKENWVRVMFDKEVELPKKFWIALNFNAEQTKGVYVSYDTKTKGEYSRVGLPGDEDEPKKTDFDGDWMVQVMLRRPEK